METLYLFTNSSLEENIIGKIGLVRLECVVPENIHTPTNERIGNSRGGWGGKGQRPRKFQRGGLAGVNVREITFPEGQFRCCDNLVQKSLLTESCYILNRFFFC